MCCSSHSLSIAAISSRVIIRSRFFAKVARISPRYNMHFVGCLLRWLVGKTVGLRIFNDENGVMNRSVVDVGGEVLAVSQFTLTASTKKGNRPSYIRAAGHDLAIPLYENFCNYLSQSALRPVRQG